MVVHNSDGVNPYAAEIASLLTARGADVRLVDPVNSEHRPLPGVDRQRRLPANFGARRLPQALRLLCGLSLTIWSATVGRRVLLVAFSRFAVEDLAFAMVAALGRPVVYVVHNPEDRERRTRMSAAARTRLLSRAQTLVVHSAQLRPGLREADRDRAVVCPHPPYIHTSSTGQSPLPLTTERRWFAYIGALRKDKGAELVPEIFRRLPAAELGHIGIAICGRGALTPSDWNGLRSQGLEVLDLTSSVPVPQHVMLALLHSKPIVIAPYVAATQSGSVILALTLGCRVIAFDQGAIAEVLGEAGLVPTGDIQAFAAAVRDGRGGASVQPLQQWESDCADAWYHTVREPWSAAATARHP